MSAMRLERHFFLFFIHKCRGLYHDMGVVFFFPYTPHPIFGQVASLQFVIRSDTRASFALGVSLWEKIATN